MASFDGDEGGEGEDSISEYGRLDEISTEKAPEQEDDEGRRGATDGDSTMIDAANPIPKP